MINRDVQFNLYYTNSCTKLLINSSRYTCNLFHSAVDCKFVKTYLKVIRNITFDQITNKSYDKWITKLIMDNYWHTTNSDWPIQCFNVEPKYVNSFFHWTGQWQNVLLKISPLKVTFQGVLFRNGVRGKFHKSSSFMLNY